MLFHHSDDPDAGVVAHIPGVQEQPQPGFADFDECAVIGGIHIVITHFAGHGPVAGSGVLLTAATLHIGHASPPQRQGQHDSGIAHVGVNVQRWRRRIAIRNIEGRAIGQ